MQESKPVVSTLQLKKTEAKEVSKKPSFRITPWWREILLGLVNLAFIVFIFVYLSKLPERSKLLKEARNASGISRVSLNLDLAKFEIETYKDEHNKLNILFPDQKQLLNFIGEVDKLKSEGSVSYFSFASETVVKEKSGYPGYPFVIEFRGTEAQVADGLEKFSKLQYVFRCINLSIEKEKGGNQAILKYGGFLYVSEDTSKN